jgi:hypothetical protein
MPTLPHTRVIRAVAVVALGVAVVGSRPAVAQVVESVAAADSDLELLERGDSGAYQRFSIKVTARDGNFVLATNKDGAAAEVRIDATEGRALWRALLETSLETLGDATAEQAVPDQSHFTVKYRVGQATGGFSAYGVDSLSDGRYRKIVVAILDLAEKHVPERVR